MIDTAFKKKKHPHTFNKGCHLSDWNKSVYLFGLSNEKAVVKEGSIQATIPQLGKTENPVLKWRASSFCNNGKPPIDGACIMGKDMESKRIDIRVIL